VQQLTDGLGVGRSAERIPWSWADGAVIAGKSTVEARPVEAASPSTLMSTITVMPDAGSTRMVTFGVLMAPISIVQACRREEGIT
jgi:hypothetical protein